MDYYDLQDQLIIDLANIDDTDFSNFCNNYDIKTPRDLVVFLEEQETDEDLEEIKLELWANSPSLRKHYNPTS